MVYVHLFELDRGNRRHNEGDTTIRVSPAKISLFARNSASLSVWDTLVVRFSSVLLIARVSPSTISAYILQSAGPFPSTLLLACCCWWSTGFRECLGFHFVIGSCYCRTGGKSHNKSSFMWTTSHTVDHSDAVIIYFLKKKNNPASHCYSLQDRPELNWPNEGGAAILAASQQPLEVYNADEYNDEHTAAMRTMEIKLHGFFCSVKCVQCWIYWCQRGEGRLYTWTILNNGNRS